MKFREKHHVRQLIPGRSNDRNALSIRIKLSLLVRIISYMSAIIPQLKDSDRRKVYHNLCPLLTPYANLLLALQEIFLFSSNNMKKHYMRKCSSRNTEIDITWWRTMIDWELAKRLGFGNIQTTAMLLTLGFWGSNGLFRASKKQINYICWKVNVFAPQNYRVWNPRQVKITGHFCRN